MDDPSGQDAVNYFDRLPDEVITKIFRYFLDELGDETSFWNLSLRSAARKPVQSPSISIISVDWTYGHNTDYSCYYKLVRNFREISADETLLNLCLTCKRFNRIINGRHFTTPDSNQWPSFKIDSRYERGLLPKDNPSAARYIRRAARSKFMQYKKLELHVDFYVDSCTIKAIIDERSSLNTIIELNFQECHLSPTNLNNILLALPNIKRLSIWDSCFEGSHRARAKGPALVKISGRVLSSLNLKVAAQPDGHPLMDFILDNLPAIEIRVQFGIPCPANNRWIRKYLLKYKNIIRSFHITFQDFQSNRVVIDKLAMSPFEGFHYYILVDSHEYSIISSETRSRPKANSDFVKYKRLEFYPFTVMNGYILKAIVDNRACLSEVVELSLHQCRVSPDDLSRIFAVLSKLERLHFCIQMRNFKITYYFYRERDPRLVPSDIHPSVFDNHEEELIHEHILANPPANVVQVEFEYESGCECRSERFDNFINYA